MTNRAPRRALRILAHLGEGNMYFKIKKLNLCLRWSVDTWTPRGISSIALKEIAPHGLRAKRPYLFRDLGKTSMAQNPFRPKRECKKLYSTYNLTDEPWEQKMGGVALDYLEISVRSSL